MHTAQLPWRQPQNRLDFAVPDSPIGTTDRGTPVHADIQEGREMNNTIEVGITLATSQEDLPVAAHSLANLISEEMPVPVRLAGIDFEDGQVLLTMAISVGTLEDIKANSTTSKVAFVLIDKVLNGLSRHQAHLSAVPEHSVAADFARELLESRSGDVEVALADLAMAA